MGNAVAERTNQNVTDIASAPQRMLEIAIEKGASLEQLQQLMALQERYEVNEARKAFNDAVAAFKSDPPTVTKDKDNKQYGSKYSSLENLVGTVNAALSPHGLNARWSFDQSDNRISVTCILSHRLGHCEQVTLSGPPDTSGSKNALQQIKSTTTYLKGATFEAVTGVATGAFDKSDDGAGSGDAALDAVTDDQAATLHALAEEVKADMPKFLQYLSRVGKSEIKTISDIPAKMYTDAVQALNQKRSAATTKPKEAQP